MQSGSGPKRLVWNLYRNCVPRLSSRSTPLLASAIDTWNGLAWRREDPKCPHGFTRALAIGIAMALFIFGTGFAASLVLAPPRASPALHARRAAAPAMLDIPRIELPSAVGAQLKEFDLKDPNTLTQAEPVSPSLALARSYQRSAWSTCIHTGGVQHLLGGGHRRHAGPHAAGRSHLRRHR